MPIAKTTKRVFVVTAGTSIRNNMRRLQQALNDADIVPEHAAERDRWSEFADRWGAGGRPTRADDRSIGAAQRLIAATHTAVVPVDQGVSDGTAGEALFIDALAHGLGFDSRSGGTAWLSAELSSLFAEGDDPPVHPQPGDHIVLVSSDLEQRVAATDLLGQILIGHIGGELTSVCTAATGQSDREKVNTALNFGRPGVSVVVVGGLTADGRDAVERTAEGLAEVLGGAYVAAVAGDKSVLLHLIGGFKSTIPLITALAAHLPLGDGVEIDLWSSNRQTPIGIHLPLLRIGVPDEEFWDLQRIGAGGVVLEEANLLRSARWNRYAWRNVDGYVELTELGRGILRLLAVVDRGRV